MKKRSLKLIIKYKSNVMFPLSGGKIEDGVVKVWHKSNSFWERFWFFVNGQILITFVNETKEKNK